MTMLKNKEHPFQYKDVNIIDDQYIYILQIQLVTFVGLRTSGLRLKSHNAQPLHYKGIISRGIKLRQ